ncbi:MAG: SDR family oxidoreductase [Thermodesulfobacteriota bacterium]|nr:SDR family oxidoreductase [Thermodesulfobacteriota bacterium]
MARGFSLDSKVSLVTGGGKGIGRAIALGLSEAGSNVVICSRKLQDLEKVCNEIQKMGKECLPVVADVTKNEDIENLVKKAKEKFGKIDILINNAATSYMRSLMDLREDGWDKIFNTNVKAVFLLSREVAKVMMEHGGGRIINITTVGAEKAEGGMGAYGTSKAALKMLTKSMALEWAPLKINVNAVGPGLTRTDFSKPLWSNPDIAKAIASGIPLGRIAEPEDMVGTVVFLASDASSYITGQSIYVNGGVWA